MYVCSKSLSLFYWFCQKVSGQNLSQSCVSYKYILKKVVILHHTGSPDYELQKIVKHYSATL